RRLVEIVDRLRRLQISLPELGYILSVEGQTPQEQDAKRRERARQICGYDGLKDGEAAGEAKIRQERQGHLTVTAEEVASVLDIAAYRCEVVEAIGLGSGAAPSGSDAACAQAIIRGFYDQHPGYDEFIYPITYGTGAVESREVDILRVSPLEATTLVASPSQRRNKLAGVRLGHFGAFFAE